MNYPAFLKKVDEAASRCDAGSLRAFIHEIARTVHESNRERFLSTLCEYCNGFEPAPTRMTDAPEIPVDEMILALEEIQNGERELEAEYNGSWHDWEDEEEEGYEYSDPDDILGNIDRAFKLLHECLDKEQYAKGLELARALSMLEVRISGDYGDYESSFDVQDLVDHDLLSIDLKQCLREAVYIACMGSESADRAEAMLAILDGFGVYSIALDDVLQIGQREINLEQLLPDWIEALAKRPAKDADRLLVEAQGMLQDNEQILYYASRFAKNHPALYLNLLRSGKADVPALMAIGLRAMKEVPVTHPTRSAIALLTAEYAFEAHEDQTGEMCWLEAFRTVPSVANYFRLRNLGKSWEAIRETVRGIYDSFYSTGRTWDRKPLAALLFFDERFDEMQSRFMSTKQGIGWSQTFMKEGIALLLMLLHRGEMQGPGMKAMVSKAVSGCAFDGAQYRMGTGIPEGAETLDLFLDCFQSWKEGVDVPESDCEAWLQRMDRWISLRVCAIMDANRRNYYGECAAFVAALGETLQSRGNAGAKEALMQRFRQAYSRRRAFHQALREYGMRS